MIQTCDSLIQEFQPPLSNRSLRFRATVAGRGLFPIQTATMEITEKQIRNFWNKVEKTDTCWLWTGCGLRSGYGQLKVEGKMRLAHRVSWLIHFGEIIDGLCVCHKCDVRECIRPDHLFLGTDSDNMRDMVMKGRGVKNGGERNGMAKLDALKVRKIAALYSTGMYSQRNLATMFEVSQPSINHVVIGKRWADKVQDLDFA
jgi:hypothetical protein